MSEAEIWLIQQTVAGNAVNGFNALLTVLFAFLATAYFVGNRLTRFQAVIISLLFVFGAGMLSFSVFGGIRRVVYFTDQLRLLHPDQSFTFSRELLGFFGFMLAAAIPVCLYCLYQIRKTPSLGAVPHR
jgi:hypothetical protein